MNNKIGVAIEDVAGLFQLGTCHPNDFYLDPSAYVRINNSITNPDYGAFYDTTDQALVSTAASQVITINSTSISSVINLSAGSRINFPNAGVFNIQFSLQLTNNDTQIQEAIIWFRKNGIDISNSASIVSVVAKHGGKKGHYILALNLVEQFLAGDYVELYWAGTDIGLSIETLPAGVAPVYPQVPSVIITATKVS